MPTPIKTWECTSTSCRVQKLEYYDGYLLKYFSLKATNPIQVKINRILNHSSCLTNSLVDPQVIVDLIHLDAFDTTTFTEIEAKHWRFWKYLDTTQLKEFYSEAISPFKHKTFLEFSQGQLKNGFHTSSQKKYRNNNRLDNLFFYGPQLIGMALEDRKRIRQMIYHALPPEAKFSLDDSFTLFDYSKIENMRWEKKSPYDFSGDYIELFSDRLTIGGWSSPRDGGSYDTSLERVWFDRHTTSSAKFPAAYKTIYAMLENAIIKV